MYRVQRLNKLNMYNFRWCLAFHTKGDSEVTGPQDTISACIK